MGLSLELSLARQRVDRKVDPKAMRWELEIELARGSVSRDLFIK